MNATSKTLILLIAALAVIATLPAVSAHAQNHDQPLKVSYLVQYHGAWTVTQYEYGYPGSMLFSTTKPWGWDALPAANKSLKITTFWYQGVSVVATVENHEKKPVREQLNYALTYVWDDPKMFDWTMMPHANPFHTTDYVITATVPPGKSSQQNDIQVNALEQITYRISTNGVSAPMQTVKYPVTVKGLPTTTPTSPP